jgi:hypothetical protein
VEGFNRDERIRGWRQDKGEGRHHAASGEKKLAMTDDESKSKLSFVNVNALIAFVDATNVKRISRSL